MTMTGFSIERKGKKVRAQVSPEVAEALCGVLEFAKKNKGSDLFEACIDRLLEKRSALAKSKNQKLVSFEPHLTYYLKNLEERHIDPVAIWSNQGTIIREDDMDWTSRYLPEFLSHVTHGVLGWRPAETPSASGAAEMVNVYVQLQRRMEAQSSPKLRETVPFTVAGLPSEANLNVLFPMFERSLPIPGDICEFGCFRGANSIKMAFMAKALGFEKRVFAFDTFEGFQIDDPGGGALGVGAFSDHFDAFGELTKWSSVLPIVPVKGDATKTCEQINDPLSFVWLDLDMGVLMDPVLKKILQHVGKNTIIGVDDVGRPETPTVEPWVNEVTGSGILREISRHEHEFIRFYQRVM